MIIIDVSRGGTQCERLPVFDAGFVDRPLRIKQNTTTDTHTTGYSSTTTHNTSPRNNNSMGGAASSEAEAPTLSCIMAQKEPITDEQIAELWSQFDDDGSNDLTVRVCIGCSVVVVLLLLWAGYTHKQHKLQPQQRQPQQHTSQRPLRRDDEPMHGIT
jgi:hypothetical protein